MATDQRSFQVLILGDPAPPEFRSILAFAQEHAPGDNYRTVGDIPQVRQIVACESWYPDLIVVLQSWPDQFAPDDVLALLAVVPLARIICCYGPWCESDGRTRIAWPLAVRVSAARAVERATSELALLAGATPLGVDNHRRREFSPKPLPLTASRTEIFEHDFGPAPRSALAPRAVMVDSPDFPWRRMLAGSLVRAGHIVTAESDQATAASVVIVWDADPWNGEQRDRLTIHRARNPSSLIIACAGFLQDDLAAALMSSGADRVWFKLDSLARLLAQIDAASTPKR